MHNDHKRLLIKVLSFIASLNVRFAVHIVLYVFIAFVYNKRREQ